jgi:exonuclease SbcC
MLEFHPGVNVIIGSSNCGKTSILRALYWARYNRPSGLAYVSHWNRDKKNLPIKPTMVEVKNTDGDIQRIRQSDFNGYKLSAGDEQQEPLEAIGMDVPEQVQNAFNLEEVNIQKQMDAPFLLSESAGDVARFFNNIIRLDLIDRVLSNAETKKRRLRQSKVDIENQLQITQKSIAGYSWLDSAEKLAGKVQKVEQYEIQCDNMKTELLESLEAYTKSLNIILDSKNAIAASSMVESIETIKSKLTDKIAVVDFLKSTIFDYQECADEIASAKKIVGASNVVEKMEALRIGMRDRASLIDGFKETMAQFSSMMNIVLGSDKVIISGEKELPKICPLCGSKL